MIFAPIDRNDVSEVPVSQRPGITRLSAYYAKRSRTRDEAMAYVCRVHGIKQISEYFGLYYSRETRIIAARSGAV
jgi:hypothetical protein